MQLMQGAILFVLGACLVLPVASPRAAEPAPAQGEPSVEVELAPLKKGSLPQVVTIYGSVEPSAAAQHAVMAPTAAVVDQIDVRVGQEVEKDAPLLRLLPSPATQIAYAQAQSALGVAADLVARTRNMVQQHLATAQQLADAEKSQTDARATLAALQAQGAGGANVLRASVGAVVTAVSTSPGTIVTEGTILVTLAGRDGLVLKAGVIPAQAGAIKAGDAATVAPLGGDTKIEAKVLLRGAMVDPATGMIPVEIALPPGQFMPGESAAAAITAGEVEGYFIPHAALLVDDKGKPYVVQAVDRTAKQVAVQVLGTGGDEDVIAGALDVSAPVVVSGNHQLQDGMKIRLAAPSAKAAP